MFKKNYSVFNFIVLFKALIYQSKFIKNNIIAETITLVSPYPTEFIINKNKFTILNKVNKIKNINHTTFEIFKYSLKNPDL